MLNSASDNLGLLFLYIIEYFVSSKTVSLILSIFALVLFVGVFYIPETPYWYMLKNRRENAIKAVTWLREMDKELVEVEVRLIEQNLDNNEKSPSFLQTIFTLKWWKYFLFFSIYLTLIEFTGFDIIFTYPIQIFSELNRTGIENKKIVIAFAFVLLIGSVISIFIIEKFKRKQMMIYYSIMNAIFLLVVIYSETYVRSYYSSIISLIFIFIFGATDSIVAYNLPWTMVSENLPTELRATVFAALCAETYIVYFFMVKLFPIIMISIPLSYFFLFFLIFSLLCAIFVAFFIKETQGIILPGNRNA